MDVVPGVRLDALGKATEAKVLRNLDRLRAHQIPFGAITVLAKHTCDQICRIYDFWADQQVNLRILPLFAGPSERDSTTFAVAESDLVDALCRLFDHRLLSTSGIQLDPLDEWLTTVIRSRMGLRVDAYDRRREGESVLVVRPNGEVFQTNEIGTDSFVLGNLAAQSWDDILVSPAYRASLERSERIAALVCGECQYLGACDGYYAHTESYELLAGRRCPVAFKVFEYVEQRLEQMKFGGNELRALAGEALHERAAAAI
jgi:radical SAM protein with 4Fe4S-binding SPASM domain